MTYENGVIYSAAGSFIFALDARTGEPLDGFGENGQASVILDVLRLRYPDVETAISMGYWFTTAPQIHDGVIYVGSTRSESFIPGGHVLAVDALAGEVLWHFNTIPQDESDQGWDIAGPTWVGGVRNGGGIWETPSIDPELGLVYVAVGNPFGDSTRRAGMNLFTDSVIALSLDEGRLEWYYQLVHHDVWDYDNGSQPILFDMEVDGEPVKALAQANKNSWLYLLDRRTGEPIHTHHRDPGLDRDRHAGRAAPAHAADSAQGERRAHGARLAGRAHRHPAGGPGGRAHRPAVHAARARPDFRARHGGRRQLRAAGLHGRRRAVLDRGVGGGDRGRRLDSQLRAAAVAAAAKSRKTAATSVAGIWLTKSVHKTILAKPMTMVNVHDAKTHLSRLLERVRAGEEIVIAKAGRPCARLMPLEPRPERVLGRYRDRDGDVPDSVFEPLTEAELAAWEGDG